MTAAQKQAVLSLGQLLNQVSSIGAFVGAIVIIVQIGDYKGRTEATMVNHERRIDKLENISDDCKNRITAIEAVTHEID
jgi:hypothetical protein